MFPCLNCGVCNIDLYRLYVSNLVADILKVSNKGEEEVT